MNIKNKLIKVLNDLKIEIDNLKKDNKILREQIKQQDNELKFISEVVDGNYNMITATH